MSGGRPVRRGPLHWIEPWFAAYALAGLLVNGMVPIMIPITAAPHGPTVVAIVVAAFFVGQLTAPFIGRIADRSGTQRLFFLGSYPVMAAAAIGFGLADATVEWVIAAMIAGAAAGAAQTLGSVFIVEGHPRQEWDDRIGWFRFTFGLGQVAGLTIGAIFAEGRVDTGWFVAGAVIVLGTFLGRIRLPHLRPAATSPPPAPEATGRKSSGLGAESRGSFGTFLVTWLLAMIAVQTILNVLPLIMADAFAVGASKTATWYLVGSVIGACLYPVCGHLADRHGSGWVLRSGLLITLAGFLAMSVAWLFDLPGRELIGVGALVVVAIGYPFDYIGGTMLAAELTVDGQGSAMGLFNSAVAAGAIVGALVPSVLAQHFGYGSLPPMAAGVMLAALLVGIPVLRRPRSPAVS